MSVRSERSGRSGGVTLKRAVLDCTEHVLRSIRARWLPHLRGAAHAIDARPFLTAEPLEPRQLLAGHPVISEFMALNESGLADADGDRSDWLELHNPTASSISLDGYHLTDDAGFLAKWRIPAVTLPAGGYLVLFASGKDRAVAGQQLHTNFSLDGNGEFLALVAPDAATVLSAYDPQYPEQLQDKSYGLGGGGGIDTPLVAHGSPATYTVPSAAIAGWNQHLFNDSAWTSANVGLGFELNTSTATLPGEREANNSLGGADDATGNFQPIESNLYHLGLKGAINAAGDGDFYKLGALNAGEYLTISASGSSTGRGALTNPRVELFRANPNNPTLVASDDDGGPGADALLNRFAIPTSDTYFVRVSAVGASAGTYDLALHLVNFSAAPGTGGAVTAELEGNNNAASATDASTSWRLIQYRSRTNGTSGSSQDWFMFRFNAGDLLTVELDAIGTMNGRVRLVSAAGVSLAYDDGSAATPAPAGNDAHLHAFVIPATGTYYVVADKDTTSGSPTYALNLYLSSFQGPPRPPLYASYISTDLQSGAHGANASAYVRIPFSVDDVDTVDTLKLRMRYDDGFVAYINGVEVARRNAPSNPAYNSAASTSLPAMGSELIDITQFTSLLVAGQNVLAIQALNAAADDPDLLVAPELIATRLVPPGEPQYFTTPTPGQQNVTGALGLVADTKFSHDRGFYDAPFQLAITTATEGAQVRYTLDGTPPTATSGLLYTGPITIDRTTTLRAAAFRAGHIPSDVDTQTYLFLDDVLRQSPDGQPMPGWPATWGANVVDYGMDPDIVNNATIGPKLENALRSIPTFSITMDLDDLFGETNGIYANPRREGRAWERPASVELIHPSGEEGFQTNAGIRIRGGFSRSTNNPKHAFRLFFRDEYGDGKLDYPVFGPDAAQSFDGFDLRTFQNYSWSFQGDSRGIFLRDQLSRDAQLAMGHNAERGDYYHLYINGVYWGLYNTAERAEASYGESYFGGDKDDYDVIKHEDSRSAATDGDTRAWYDLWSQASAGLASNADYFRIQGRNADGSINPALQNLVDVENLIDYMLVIYYGGNLDAPISNFMGNNGVNNFYAMRSRVANEGFRFFAHDSEHTYLTHVNRGVNEDRTGPYPAGDTFDRMNPQWLFQQMWANAEFRLKVADHVHKHFFNVGALTPASVTNRFQSRRSEIENAVHAESARWGDSKQSSPLTHAHWLTEINNILQNYIPYRTGIVLGQLKGKNLYPDVAAPVFSQFGGIITPGYKLTMTAPGGGTIYYTTDGSDPRLLGGGVAPTAQVYDGPIELAETTRVLARVLRGGVWSALDDATFSTNLSALRVSEIMYHPAPALPGEGAYGEDDFEYVELLNTSNAPMRLLGSQFTAGIEFTFGDVRLQPGERVLVVENRAAFESRYGAGLNIAGEYTGRLDNAGEQLRLQAATGHHIFDFSYDDGWYSHTDGEGYSLVAIDPAARSTTYATKPNWRASALPLGKPGQPDPGYNPGQIAINEVMASGPDGAPDWIEIHNATDAPADIGGWFLSDDDADRRKYVFPEGTIIPANGLLLLHEDQHFGRAGNPGVLTPFTVDHLADALYLSNHDGAGNIAGYREKEDFESVEPGVSLGRHVKPTGADFVAQIAPTPGAPNAGPRIGPVVINELLYLPEENMPQFVELHNITDAPVPLFDPANPDNTWRFTRGIDFSFPQGATIPANGLALVVPIDPELFRSMYQVHRSVQIFGPFTGTLATGGENIELSRPGLPGTGADGAVPYHAVDRIAYDIDRPWPNLIGTLGNSIARRNAAEYGNDAINWRSEFQRSASPGYHNFDGTVPSAQIIPVAPDPHPGAIDALTIRFSEIVRGFDLSDLTLARGETILSLAGATLTSDDDITWVLGNLADITAAEGDYTLALAAAGSGIIDLARRPIFADASDAFTITAAGGGGSVISGTDGDDDMLLRRSGENVLVWLNSDPSLPPTQVLPIDPFDSIQVSLLGGNDTLVLDLQDGLPPLPDDATIDGGDGHDVVRIIGSSAAQPLRIADASLSIGFTDLDHAAVERFLLSLPGAPALDLAGAARAALTRTFRTGGLTIGADAQLDLAGNAMILDATPETRDALARQLADLVQRARNANPRWSGPGLTDSHIGDNSLRGLAPIPNPGLTTFAGQEVDENTVLLRSTYNGDANLDGKINADDYFRIDSGFLAQPPSPLYTQGDFNYDGHINADDYFLIDSAFLGQVATAFSTASSASSAIIFDESEPAARKTRRSARPSALWDQTPTTRRPR